MSNTATPTTVLKRLREIAREFGLISASGGEIKMPFAGSLDLNGVSMDHVEVKMAERGCGSWIFYRWGQWLITEDRFHLHSVVIALDEHHSVKNVELPIVEVDQSCHTVKVTIGGTHQNFGFLHDTKIGEKIPKKGVLRGNIRAGRYRIYFNPADDHYFLQLL
jgi:hypothetical protein